MSLIENLRNSTESTSTRFLIGVVVLAFVIAGGSSTRQGCAGGMAATVNGETISIQEFDRALRSNFQRAGSGLDDAQRAELQRSTLDQLVRQRVLLQEARRLGLAVSDAELARSIKAVPAFQKDEKFDEKTYLERLERMSYSRSEFEAMQRELLLLQKLQEVVARGALVTEAEVRAAWQKENTQVDLTFVRFPPAEFLGDVVVSDADRDALLAARASDIEARYKADYERSYNLPKRYHLHAVLLRTDIGGVDKAAVQARAEAIAAQAKAGSDFADLARRWSEDLSAKDGGDLGVLAADALDPALATAADATGAGNISAVVETGRGFQVLRVESIEEAHVIPLEEARAQIAVDMLKLERVDAVASEYAARVLSAWSAGGVLPRELVDAKGLPVVETGRFSLGDDGVPSLADGPAAAELLAAVAKAKSGEVLAAPFTIKGITYAVQVVAHDAPAESQYADGARMIRARLEFTRQQSYFSAWMASLEKEADVVRYYGEG